MNACPFQLLPCGVICSAATEDKYSDLTPVGLKAPSPGLTALPVPGAWGDGPGRQGRLSAEEALSQGVQRIAALP